MTFKTLAAAALALTMAAPALALPVEVDFNIVDFNTSTPIKVTFFGLDNGTTERQAATAIRVVGRYDVYGPHSLTGLTSVRENSFFFFPDGTLVDARFDLNGGFNGNNARDRDGVKGTAAILASLVCNADVGGICNWNESSNIFPGNYYGFGDAEIIVREVVAPVPLPAGGVLLFSALAGVAALKRRKTAAA
jgi:hypothetical protein